MPLSDSERERRAAALLHHRSAALAPGDPTSPPLTSSSTFHLPSGDPDGCYYGRNDTPIWQAVESQLALIENAPCLLFPSGMAAISAALLSTLSNGSRVLIPADGYYATRRFAHAGLARFGISVSESATTAVAQADLEGVDVVFIETPANPTLDVCDIGLVVERAHAVGALVIADNTTSTAYLQQPLDLGVDIVVAADTKAPGGHSDLLAGHIATRDAALMTSLREWRSLGGAIIGPQQAWLLHRGLETLELRLSRMCSTAQSLSEQLSRHRRVSGVRYPGLVDDPSHAVAKRQMSGFGTIVSFELESAEAAAGFIEHCPLVASATSFGGVHSSAERRARWGDAVAEGFVRLSVGCEPVDTLIEAVLAALD